MRRVIIIVKNPEKNPAHFPIICEIPFRPKLLTDFKSEGWEVCAALARSLGVAIEKRDADIDEIERTSTHNFFIGELLPLLQPINGDPPVYTLLCVYSSIHTVIRAVFYQ